MNDRFEYLSGFPYMSFINKKVAFIKCSLWGFLNFTVKKFKSQKKYTVKIFVQISSIIKAHLKTI